ncbi:MAG: hypothetical protein AAB019_07280, partial [Planctomycetota bacterium]
RPALPRFWRGLNDKFSDDSYEQREAENEKEINERLLASCSVVGSVIYNLDYSADGKYVCLSASDVEIRSGEDLSLINSWPEGGVGPVAFHPNSQILAQAVAKINDNDPEAPVDIRSIPGGKLLKTIYADTDGENWDGPTDKFGHGTTIYQIKFSPDGQYMLTRTGGEWKVMVWETKTWELKYALRKDEERTQVEWAEFSPDSQSVYVSLELPFYDKDGRPVPVDQQAGWFIQYRLSDGQKVRELRDPSLLGCYRFYFSSRDKKIILEGVKKRNEQNGRMLLLAIFTLTPPQELIWLPRLPDADHGLDVFFPSYAAGSSSGSFSIWDINEQKYLYGVELHRRIKGIKFSSDGKKIAVSSGGSCYLFRVP